jgi:hypothetical protein
MLCSGLVSPVHLAHPLAVSPRQVIVHSHNMNTPSGEGVQVGGQDSYKGLSLSSAHLRNLALVENHASNELRIKRAQTQHAAGALADDLWRLHGGAWEGRRELHGVLELRRPHGVWCTLPGSQGCHSCLTAKASGRMLSSCSPLATLCLNSSVLALSCSSVSPCMPLSSRLIASTLSWYFLRVASEGSALKSLPKKACAVTHRLRAIVALRATRTGATEQFEPLEAASMAVGLRALQRPFVTGGKHTPRGAAELVLLRPAPSSPNPLLLCTSMVDGRGRED